MISRRVYLAALATAVAATAVPRTARAQGERVRTIGFFANTPPEASAAVAGYIRGWREALAGLGWVEGRNLRVEYRFGAGATPERIAAMAAELARPGVDLIFAPTSQYVEAARRATATLPIVFAVHGDPLGAGHVASLARPGGNITGSAILQPEVAAKTLDLLRQALPGITDAALLWSPDNLAHRAAVEPVARGAATLGLRLHPVALADAGDLDGAFARIARERLGPALILASPLLNAALGHAAALSLRHDVPAVYGTAEFAREGGLMSYGADILDLYRRSAAFVDKILRGARPADLPVEQPGTFELLINLKAARALGLDIPRAILLRADEVIE